jgi:hypothetical protein
MQRKCDGKTTCTFFIRKAELGSSSCSGDSNKFLVRYTCEVDACKPGKLKVGRLVSWLVSQLVGWFVGQSDGSCRAVIAVGRSIRQLKSSINCVHY